MEDSVKFGKIKVYGKEIDLDNTPTEELIKMRKILNNRLNNLVEQYADMSKKILE